MRKYIVREVGGMMYCHWQGRHQTQRILPDRAVYAHPDDPSAWRFDPYFGYAALAISILQDASPEHGMPYIMAGDWANTYLLIEDGAMSQITQPCIDAWVNGWAAAYLNNRAGVRATPVDPPMTEGGI